MIFHARYVVPIDGPVIEDGCVESVRGRIIDVRKCTAADKASRSQADHADAVLLPGLVNAHTHLELTHLAGKVPPGPDFTGWLERLVKFSITSPPDPATIRRSTAQGIQLSLAEGVTTVGDITRCPDETRPVLARYCLRAVSFGEVVAVGATRDLLEPRLDAAMRMSPAPSQVRVGISPHSPYTVEVEGLRICASRAEVHDLPLCIHLAESPHEDEFARAGTGPLRDYLCRLDVWDDRVPVGGCDVIELANRCGLLTPGSIAAHVNYVTDDQLALLASTGVHVAYCPRTHRAFGHPPHRFRDMLARDVNVCVGTDGLASNPSLSILHELRFLHRTYPDFPPAELLRMGTIRGAKALGCAAQVGSLAPGKWADLVVIPFDAGGAADPLINVLESTLAPVFVYVAGRRAKHCTNSSRA